MVRLVLVHEGQVILLRSEEEVYVIILLAGYIRICNLCRVIAAVEEFIAIRRVNQLELRFQV